jgi:hypothetical protein
MTGSGNPQPSIASGPGAPRSHQRTRISCYAASDRTACAAFFKESRMEFDNATNLDRKFRGTKRKGEAPTIAFEFLTQLIKRHMRASLHLKTQIQTPRT